ncbi:hypothetical protein [Streptomyces sp. RerS4]|nr:hypothetical protein [Streptomyces sp. RerS4]UQX01595.1 hypothetical protein M4D82_14555 [Streptomyces sp. RerS4]
MARKGSSDLPQDRGCLRWVPVFHRTLGRWWYAAPFLLASVAYVRAQTV